MNKFFFIIATLTASICFGQDGSISEIVEKACEAYSKININDSNKTRLMNKLSNVGTKVGSDNQQLVKGIFEEIRKENPEISNKEVFKLYLIQFTIGSIDSCPAYLELISSIAGPGPEKNKTLELIQKEVDSYLSSTAILIYNELNEGIVQVITDSLLGNTGLVEEDYKDGLRNESLMYDIAIYLSLNSKSYLKVTSAKQIDVAIESGATPVPEF